jgi:hypothetical protein
VCEAGFFGVGVNFDRSTNWSNFGGQSDPAAPGSKASFNARFDCIPWPRTGEALSGPWSWGGAGSVDVLGVGRTITSFDASMAEREGEAMGCMDADVARLNEDGAED